MRDFPGASLFGGALFDMADLHEPLLADVRRAVGFASRWGVRAEEDRDAARQRVRGQALAAVGATDVRRGYGLTSTGVGVVPVIGSLGPARYWCWTTYEEIVAGVANAAADPDVKGVLLLVDSPGGYVTGCQEAAEAVRALAGAPAQKPVHAFAQDLAASAAFWVGSSAARLSASPTADVGSVGALCVHVEASKALEEFGIRATIVRSGARKAEANILEPLSEAAQAQLQAGIDAAAELFVQAVARNRGMDPEAVRATEAACLTAQQGLAVGLIDAVASTAEALAQLTPSAAPATPVARAAPRTGSGTRQSARTAKRSGPMLTDKEKRARRDRIAEAVSAEPADDAEAAKQYDDVAGIVAEAEPEAEDDGGASAAQGGADAAVKAERQRAAGILALEGAKNNPAAAQVCIAQGLTVEASAEILKTSASAPTSTASQLAEARQRAAGSALGVASAEGGEGGDAVAFILGSHAQATGRKPATAS